MIGVLLAVQGAVSQGVLWGIMTLGVYLTFRVLDIADLTVDGSFATGGAVSAVLILNGMNPYLSLIFAFMAGMICCRELKDGYRLRDFKWEELLFSP